jgi:hypothetical protein
VKATPVDLRSPLSTMTARPAPQLPNEQHGSRYAFEPKLDRDGMAWQARTAWQARVLRGDGRVTWVSTGPRHLFAFGMRPEDGLTDWALLMTERSPLTIVHVAEPTAAALDDWDWGV